MNRMKPYAADATGRSTGETSMTAWVVRVLFTPIIAPATITHTTITVRVVGARPRSRASTTANSARLTYSVGAVPKRRCSRGATNTENTATSMPQPKNTAPSS